MRLIVFACILGLAVNTTAQNPPAKTGLTQLVVGLHAGAWSDRAEAYEQLSNDPVAMRAPEVRTALIELLDRENHADISKEPGFDSNGYHEDHAGYISALLGTVAAVTDWKDAGQLCILAHAPYNFDSAFAAKLASAGKPIVPCLIQMAQSTSLFDRYKAAAVLVQLRAKHDNLSPETVQNIIQVTIAALHDSRVFVRMGTIAVLREFGGQDTIPALQEVADKDPQDQTVREYAADAIKVMRERLDHGSAESRGTTQ